MKANISCQKLLVTVLLPLPLWLATGVTQSQAQPLQPLQSQAPTEQSSYASRIINRKGVHDMDPNVYVYTAEFAQRFQMPQEWVSNELRGADAVAFRVVPSPYKTCGWGGDPKACRSDEVRCEMDLYFDHRRNPLPWDERRLERYSGHYQTSVNFLWDGQRNLAFQRLATPKREKDNFFSSNSPFVDPKTGMGLGWQDFKKGNGVGGWTGMSSYDKEIFVGISLVTLGTSCNSARDEIWLASESIYPHEVPNSPALNKRIVLPPNWQSRVQQAMQETNERNEAFFKREGEKAIKALRESPVPNKSVVPLQ